MTVLVWDGETLAADRQMSLSGTIAQVTKIRRIGDSLFGGAGDFDSCQVLFKWVEDGKDPTKWPECQKDKDRWTTLLEITKDKRILRYEREPIPFEIEEKFYAFGSGMDLAIGAMEMGADAVKAVEVAIKYTQCCGLGYNTLRLA